MNNRLLRIKEVAAMLGTTTGVAASILEKHGIKPIDFGYGRSRGLRWLESAVQDLLLALHQKAQPRPRREKNPRKDAVMLPKVPLHAMGINAVYDLTTNQRVH